MEYTVSATEALSTSARKAARSPCTARTARAEKLSMPDVDGFAAEVRYFVECCREGIKAGPCARREESANAVKLARLILEARNKNGERLECNFSTRWKSA